MKKSNILMATTLLVLSIGVSGCSLFTKNQVNKIDPVMPDDRENIAVVKDPKVYTPEEIKTGVVKGDWAIETVYGKKAVGEKAPFLKFVPSEHRVYGNNGCNIINATYLYNPKDSTISFDNVVSTMMMCQMEGLTDYEINTALGATKFYTWNVNGHDYYLNFFDEAGREVMQLMHQNFEFLNGTWAVRKINQTNIDDPDMKMVIDIDEGKLHGNTGCNIMNGEISVDMEQANSISFSNIITTRMACPEGSQETALLVALEEVTAARPVSVNEVVLYDSRHKPVLTLVRTTDK
ncbi:MAG: META domain-containing protein [Muribaculaceae bacterium]|nr:META domain-containing protein [Muribaculaceae bacterium]